MTLRRLSLPIDLLVVLFIASSLIGYAVAYDQALSHILVAVLASGMLYLLAAHGGHSRTYGRFISVALVGVGTLFALVFIGQYGYENYGETPGVIQRLGELTTFLPVIQGYSMHVNAAATTLEMVVPLGVALLLSSRKRVEQVGWALAVLVLLYALGLSYSRGAIIGLAVGLAAALLLRFSPRLALLLVAGVILGGLALIVFAPPELPIDWILSRRDLYLNSLYVASDYAFTGIGLGDTFAMIYSRYGLLIQVPFLTYPHHLYLSIWMNQGAAGILTFGALLLVLFLFVDRVMRVSKPSRLFYGAWLALAVTLVHGLFDSRHYVEWWLMPEMFVLMGLIVAVGRGALIGAAAAEDNLPVRYLPRLLPIGAAVVLVVLVVVFQQPLWAAWHTNMGALVETHADLSPDLSDAEREQLSESAQMQYGLALDTASHWPNASRRLGNLQVHLRDYAAAVPLLEIAATAEPNNPATIKGLGLAYTWAGQLEQAAATFAQLPEAKPMIDELFTWSRYSMEQSQPLLAAYAGDVALIMSGGNSNVNVLIYVADLYRDAGEAESASTWYSRALEIEPGNVVAQSNLDALD